MFSNFSTAEIVIIAVIVLVFFGANKLKELARGLGEASAELKKVTKDTTNSED